MYNIRFYESSLTRCRDTSSVKEMTMLSHRFKNPVAHEAKAWELIMMMMSCTSPLYTHWPSFTVATYHSTTYSIQKYILAIRFTLFNHCKYSFWSTLIKCHAYSYVYIIILLPQSQSNYYCYHFRSSRLLLLTSYVSSLLTSYWAEAVSFRTFALPHWRTCYGWFWMLGMLHRGCQSGGPCI